MIEREVFQYTGKSGNTLTGVTRAKYASLAASHYTDAAVNPGVWAVVINGGAIFAGFVKPS